MTNEAIALALTLGTFADLVDANDWAVNTVREYAAERGYNAAAIVAEETRRIDADALNLAAYLTCRRTGSHHRLTRLVRRAVWAAIATRRACRAAA